MNVPPLALLAGYLVDKLGVYKVMIFCSICLLSGWFPKYQLSFSMGFIIAVGRVAMFVSTFVYPHVYDRNGLIWEAALIGIYVSIFSFFSVLLLNFVDRICVGENEKQNCENNENVHLGDIKKFIPIYWLIIITICFTFMILEPFMANIQ
ncbi:hypothetical protein IMG5_171820, partial [Ichthyophthirius multifiliis]